MNNGLFWAWYIEDVVIPELKLLQDLTERKVMRAFSDLEAEAQAVEEATWKRLSETPTWDDDIDPSVLAEEALEAGVDFCVTAKQIQQGLRNLMTVSLYHLHEQQLLFLHRRELLDWHEENNQKLLTAAEATKRLKVNGIDIERFVSSSKLNELRLVANVTKHADGPSATQLKALRRDLFVPPNLSEDVPRSSFPPREHVFRPMIGEDLYVTGEDLAGYFEAVLGFWHDLSKALSA